MINLQYYYIGKPEDFEFKVNQILYLILGEKTIEQV